MEEEKIEAAMDISNAYGCSFICEEVRIYFERNPEQIILPFGWSIKTPPKGFMGQLAFHFDLLPAIEPSDCLPDLHNTALTTMAFIALKYCIPLLDKALETWASDLLKLGKQVFDQYQSWFNTMSDFAARFILLENSDQGRRKLSDLDVVSLQTPVRRF